MGTKRRSQPLRRLAEAALKDTSGKLHKELGSLEDISPQGACLQVEEALPPDTVLTIIYPGGKFIARVKYCNLQETGYFVGVEFEGGYRWSRRLYDPPHLLQICRHGRED